MASHAEFYRQSVVPSMILLCFLSCSQSEFLIRLPISHTLPLIKLLTKYAHKAYPSSPNTSTITSIIKSTIIKTSTTTTASLLPLLPPNLKPHRRLESHARIPIQITVHTTMSSSSHSSFSGVSPNDETYISDSSYSTASSPPLPLKIYFSPPPRRRDQRPLTPDSAPWYTYNSTAVDSVSLSDHPVPKIQSREVERVEPQAPKPITASEIASLVEEAIEDCASVETKNESAIEGFSPVEDELRAIAGRGFRWREEPRHQYYREPVPDKRGIPIPGGPEKEPSMPSIPFAGRVHNCKDNITEYCARGVSGWSTFAQYRMDQAEAQIPQPSGIRIGWRRLRLVKRKDAKIVLDDDEFPAGCNVREMNVARWNQQHNRRPVRHGPMMS